MLNGPLPASPSSVYAPVVSQGFGENASIPGVMSASLWSGPCLPVSCVPLLPRSCTDTAKPRRTGFYALSGPPLRCWEHLSLQDSSHQGLCSHSFWSLNMPTLGLCSVPVTTVPQPAACTAAECQGPRPTPGCRSVAPHVTKPSQTSCIATSMQRPARQEVTVFLCRGCQACSFAENLFCLCQAPRAGTRQGEAFRGSKSCPPPR